ncbi:P-loop NTPase, partial [Streptomyces sp. NPDC002990]
MPAPPPGAPSVLTNAATPTRQIPASPSASTTSRAKEAGPLSAVLLRPPPRPPDADIGSPPSLVRRPRSRYAVASGKGGVGKSSVTVNLAAAMA